MAFSDADAVTRVRQDVREALERNGLAPPHLPVVVGVSGGADSLCLLDVMVTLLEGARRRIVVVHVDHQLRAASSHDADHVRAIAAGYGLRCEVRTVDVLALAAAEGRGIEEAARLARYRALRDVADGLGTPVVATGHTRDDSVETVLLHLLRGSGRAGLGGISDDEAFDSRALGDAGVPGAKRALRVVRPLLKVGRAETVAYCEARKIPYLTDESNADPTFARNRIRGHLLPVLRTYNPSIDLALARMANILGDEDEWLDEVAVDRWAELRVDSGVDEVLSLAEWRRQPLPIQRRIVRLMADSLGYQEIGFEAVERALAVGRESGPPRAELGGGVTVERRRDTLFFTRSQRMPHD